MSSTALFAPIVAPIQSAYVGDDCKIVFTLNDFNTNNDFQFVKCKLTNISANISYGSVSSERVFSKDSCQWSDDGKVCTLTLQPPSSYNDIDKYYQVQIILGETANGPWSAPSKTTLIRRIGAPVISSNDPTENIATIVVSKDRNLTGVSGIVPFSNGSKETIGEYYIEVYSGEMRAYRSKNIKNNLGTSFDCKINDCFLEAGEYFIRVNFLTLNGYKFYIQTDLTIEPLLSGLAINAQYSSIENDIASGGLKLKIMFATSEIQHNTKIKIYRSDDKYSFLNWQDIGGTISAGSSFEFVDLFTDPGVGYKYYFEMIDADKKGTIFSDKPVIADVTDIFLTSDDIHAAIRYNPNISGLKWVTQESITNSLGGRFPIVRKNGDTYYRQFSLSGTLAFEEDYYAIKEVMGTDSRNIALNEYAPHLFNYERNIYFTDSEQFNKIKTILTTKEKEYCYKHFRDIMLSFLTDSKIKLFKSSTEGMILVYLSGVSFTPNKQLGRNIYDFSVTCTEIDEATKENFDKYGILSNNDYESNKAKIVAFYQDSNDSTVYSIQHVDSDNLEAEPVYD